MTQKDATQNIVINKKVIVFGSSGLIGEKICEKIISQNYKLVEAGRTKVMQESDFRESDFCNLKSIIRSLDKVELKDGDAIVFAHRGRYYNPNDEADSLYSNIEIEINPYLAIYQMLRSQRSENLSLNIVNITSNSHRSGAYDIAFSYHVTKAAQAAAGQMLAYIPGQRIYSNNISFGEVIDNSINSHSSYHLKLFDKARLYLNGKKLPSTDEVGNLALVLCSANLYSLSGQTIYIDGGINHLSIESMLRSAK